MADRDNFGVLVDLSHLPLVHETPRECLRHLGGHITHAHIGNAVCRRADDYLYGDFHPRFSVPHSAVGPEQVAGFLRELFAVGFLGEDRRPRILRMGHTRPSGRTFRGIHMVWSGISCKDTGWR